MLNQYADLRHSPFFKEQDGKVVYSKVERDANFIHRKTNSISINADILERCDMVKVHLQHLNVIIQASKEMFMKAKLINYHGELKFYLPVEKWVVVQGAEDWFESIQSQKTPITKNENMKKLTPLCNP